MGRTGEGWFGAAASVLATRVGASPATQLRWYDRGGNHLGDLTSPGRFAERPSRGTAGRSPFRSTSPIPPAATSGSSRLFGKDRGRRLTFGGSAAA